MRLQDLLMLILLQTMWGAMPTMVKIALQEIPVETLIFLRYGITSLSLMLLTSLLRQHAAIPKRDWRWVILLGVIVYVVSPLLAFNGMRMSQALDISVLVSLEPLATAILAFLILRERLSRWQVLSIALAIPGVLLLSGLHTFGAADATAERHFTIARLLGNSFFLLSLFCEGSHTVLGRLLTGRYSPLALSAYSFTIGFLVFTGVYIWLGHEQLSFVLTHSLQWQTWGAILYLSLLCSAFGYTMWFFILQRLPANTIAISLYLQSIVGALIGHYWLKESLSTTAWLGAGLIVIAVTLGIYLKPSNES